MDRSRTAVLIAGVVALVAALFAVGSAVTSQEDDPVAAPTTVAVPVTTVVGAVTTAPVDSGGGGDTTPVTSVAAAGAAFDIEIAEFAFGPADAVVPVGTTVTWTNNDGRDHTVVAANDAFPESPNLGDGATYSFTFTEPGTYPYICGIHPQMRGTIVVEG